MNAPSLPRFFQKPPENSFPIYSPEGDAADTHSEKFLSGARTPTAQRSGRLPGTILTPRARSAQELPQPRAPRERRLWKGLKMDHRPIPRVRRWVALASFALATAFAGMAAEPATKPGAATTPTTAPAADQNGPIIKDVYRKHFLIGTAGDFPGNYSDAEKALAGKHFNVLTPENCMKPAPIHPEEGTWRFDRTDALVKFAEENGLAVHGHT